MIVDLMRVLLARVAEPAACACRTVRRGAIPGGASSGQHHHRTSAGLANRLRSARAAFSGSSSTGSAEGRAMEIIDELGNTHRRSTGAAASDYVVCAAPWIPAVTIRTRRPATVACTVPRAVACGRLSRAEAEYQESLIK